MTKKIWLFVLSAIVIFSVWVSFADIVEPNTHRVDRCLKVTNPHEIPWYKLIVRRDEFEYGLTNYSVYSVEKDKCLPHFPQWWSTRSSDIPYLVDENIDISNLDNLPSREFESKLWTFFKLDEINPNWWRVSDSNPLTSETLIYKIVKDWDIYKLDLIKSGGIVELNGGGLVKFWIAWILTILIETIVLFAIAKLFRKKDQISNWRILLIWILASTITLPLLRFVIPLFITDGVEYTVIWELLVTLVEIFIIKYWLKVSRGKAILASIICNLCSYLFGVLFL